MARSRAIERRQRVRPSAWYKHLKIRYSSAAPYDIYLTSSKSCSLPPMASQQANTAKTSHGLVSGETAKTNWIEYLMISRVLKIANWLVILSLAVLTVVPADDRPSTGLWHGSEHFFAFGLAGLLFEWAQPRELRTNLFAAVVFSLALELSQIALPTRHARLEDFLVDAIASCLGISVAYASRYLFRAFVTAA